MNNISDSLLISIRRGMTFYKTLELYNISMLYTTMNVQIRPLVTNIIINSRK